MAYKFKELAVDTYQVEEHTIIKKGNGSWQVTPEVTKPSLEKAIYEFTTSLDATEGAFRFGAPFQKLIKK